VITDIGDINKAIHISEKQMNIFKDETSYAKMCLVKELIQYIDL
jgi:hypothetical protein